MIYGYARISTKKQNIERQIRNIKDLYSNAVIIKEEYTGTTFQGRKELDKLLKVVKQNDIIVFDSVSRMSRNADEGFQLYQKLFNSGITLVFLKEPHINTETYKKAMQNQLELTGSAVDEILKGINKYLMKLAKEQIRLAFQQAEKEVQDLRQRTKEGIITARMKGKQIGQEKGAKLNVKKKPERKQLIKKYSKDFDGMLTDKEVIKQIGIARNTYYKYKKELLEELMQEQK